MELNVMSFVLMIPAFLLGWIGCEAYSFYSHERKMKRWRKGDG